MYNSENQPQRDIHYSKKIRAGKRTYYFDVKSTRNSDLYLTITESKRMPGESEENPIFEKHKLFLYKEDFEKFANGLTDVLQYIKQNTSKTEPLKDNESNGESQGGTNYTDVNFDDLGK